MLPPMGENGPRTSVDQQFVDRLRTLDLPQNQLSVVIDREEPLIVEPSGPLGIKVWPSVHHVGYETNPMVDARLPDGSRVNVIAPPLAIDGAALTIRKFKKDKLTLDQLVNFGTITPEGATILQIIGRVRCNVIISGGTGSGKTTLLNCLTRPFGTNINRSFEPMISDLPVRIVKDDAQQPSVADGFLQVTVCLLAIAQIDDATRCALGPLAGSRR